MSKAMDSQSAATATTHVAAATPGEALMSGIAVAASTREQAVLTRARSHKFFDEK